jgi:hypothetical protein
VGGGGISRKAANQAGCISQKKHVFLKIYFIRVNKYAAKLTRRIEYKPAKRLPAV